MNQSEIHAGTFQQLLPKLENALQKTDPRYWTEISRELVNELSQVAPPQNAEHRLLEKGIGEEKYYAIRNDELASLKDIAELVSGLAASIAKPSAALAPLVRLLFRLRTKRVELTLLEGLVLTHVKQTKEAGDTVSGIRKALCEQVPCNESQIKTILEKLTAVVPKDSSKPMRLVRRSRNRWFIDNV